MGVWESPALILRYMLAQSHSSTVAHHLVDRPSARRVERRVKLSRRDGHLSTMTLCTGAYADVFDTASVHSSNDTNVRTSAQCCPSSSPPATERTTCSHGISAIPRASDVPLDQSRPKPHSRGSALKRLANLEQSGCLSAPTGVRAPSRLQLIVNPARLLCRRTGHFLARSPDAPSNGRVASHRLIPVDARR